MAIDMLDADPATTHIVLISKAARPPRDWRRLVLDRVARAAKNPSRSAFSAPPILR